MAKAKIPTNQKGNIPIKWDEKRKRWKLTTYEGGKKRQFFKKEEDALKAWKSHVRTVEKHGKQAAEYDAVAHREYQEAKRIAGDQDLREVARFYASLHPVNAVDLNVSKAIETFNAQKKQRKVSSRHAETLRIHLSKFEKSFGKKNVRQVAGNRVLAWLLEIAKHRDPRTVWNYYGSLCNFFNWCQRRKLIAHAPTADITEYDLPVMPSKPKGVLTLEQSASMMNWLDANRPNLVAWHAIQLFAGIRNAEANRFLWEWVDFEKRVINMPGWLFEQGEDAEKPEATLIVKTGDDWALHDLPDNLWTWLSKYKKESGPFGSHTPKVITLLRKKHFSTLPVPIPEWPSNAMRHTFCTMLISLHSDAAKVANWSRHTNAKQLYDSYVGKLVAKKTAEAFCKIMPTA